MNMRLIPLPPSAEDSVHVIDTLDWDCEFAERSVAEAQQLRISRFLRGAGAAVLRELFSRISPEDEVWRLDLLEIDLGDLDPEASQEAWADRLRDRLWRELLRLRRRVDAEPGAVDPFAAPHPLREQERYDFIHYLEHGHLPWSLAPGTRRDLAGWLERLVKEDGAGLWQALGKLPTDGRALERLGHIAPTHGLQALLASRNPALAEALDLIDGSVLSSAVDAGRITREQARELGRECRMASLRTLLRAEGRTTGSDLTRILARVLAATLARYLPDRDMTAGNLTPPTSPSTPAQRLLAAVSEALRSAPTRSGRSAPQDIAAVEHTHAGTGKPAQTRRARLLADALASQSRRRPPAAGGRQAAGFLAAELAALIARRDQFAATDGPTRRAPAWRAPRQLPTWLAEALAASPPGWAPGPGGVSDFAIIGGETAAPLSWVQIRRFFGDYAHLQPRRGRLGPRRNVAASFSPTTPEVRLAARLSAAALLRRPGALASPGPQARERNPASAKRRRPAQSGVVRQPPSTGRDAGLTRRWAPRDFHHISERRDTLLALLALLGDRLGQVSPRRGRDHQANSRAPRRGRLGNADASRSSLTALLTWLARAGGVPAGTELATSKGYSRRPTAAARTLTSDQAARARAMAGRIPGKLRPGTPPRPVFRLRATAGTPQPTTPRHDGSGAVLFDVLATLLDNAPARKRRFKPAWAERLRTPAPTREVRPLNARDRLAASDRPRFRSRTKVQSGRSRPGVAGLANLLRAMTSARPAPGRHDPGRAGAHVSPGLRFRWLPGISRKTTARTGLNDLATLLAAPTPARQDVAQPERRPGFRYRTVPLHHPGRGANRARLDRPARRLVGDIAALPGRHPPRPARKQDLASAGGFSQSPRSDRRPTLAFRPVPAPATTRPSGRLREQARQWVARRLAHGNSRMPGGGGPAVMLARLREHYAAQPARERPGTHRDLRPAAPKPARVERNNRPPRFAAASGPDRHRVMMGTPKRGLARLASLGRAALAALLSTLMSATGAPGRHQAARAGGTREVRGWRRGSLQASRAWTRLEAMAPGLFTPWPGQPASVDARWRRSTLRPPLPTRSRTAAAAARGESPSPYASRPANGPVAARPGAAVTGHFATTPDERRMSRQPAGGSTFNPVRAVTAPPTRYWWTRLTRKLAELARHGKAGLATALGEFPGVQGAGYAQSDAAWLAGHEGAVQSTLTPTPDEILALDGIAVGNAGLVLLAAYAPRLFDMLELLQGNAFVDAAAQDHAIHCLEYLVHGHNDSSEPEWVLDKLLCGVPLARVVPPCPGLDATTRERLDEMLRAVIAHWSILGHTSVAGLRESFLQRAGRLERDEDAAGPRFHLQVEARAFDMLLDRLPWSYSTIRLPWMEGVLHVDWR